MLLLDKGNTLMKKEGNLFDAAMGHVMVLKYVNLLIPFY